MASQKSKKKKWTWKGRILYVLFLIGFVLAVGEIAVRLMGFSAWSPEKYTFEVEPGDSFFEPDEKLGYKGRPGTFHLTLSDTLKVSVTHDDAGYRITSPPIDSVDDRPEVWVFGCSFTHGYGVNDPDNYPWMLQEAFPSYKVRNFGMDGYGTYHSLLQLESLLEANESARLVILAYGGFHDQRNVNNRYWKKALSGRDIAEGIEFPFVRYNESGELVPGMEKPAYKPWPLMRYSALMHYLENASNRSENEELRPYDVTRDIIHRMSELAASKNSSFVVANIFRHDESTKMMNSLNDGIKTLDISIDLEDASMKILPNDGHPNRKGHLQMAGMLIEYLNTQNLLPQLYESQDSIP